MKIFFKITGILIILLLLILYLLFLFVLPKAVDLNQFKPDLQKIVKEQTNLLLDFDNPQISTTPLLSAGVTAENISIKLPDNSEVIKADYFKGRISLPYLLLLTVKVSAAEIQNPIINIDIADGKEFKAVKAFEEVLNKKEENIEKTLQITQEPAIDPSLIKIMVPAIKIYNYIAKINDLKTGNYLKLQGDELILGYKNGKSASIKTYAELFVNETKNIIADIDIDTFLPAPAVLDEEDDKAQRVEIPFVNPVAMYMAYDLKTNISSKIKIRNRNNTITSNGYFNVDNFTLNLDGINLPESKLHITTKGTKANIDSDLFITDKEKITLLGMLNYSKRPSLDIAINTSQISTDNIISLIRATLNSLHIQNELQQIRGEGYFSANTKIKTNFKKLNSQGNITIKECIIKNIKEKKTLAKINSIISLDNSILKFVDTNLEIADTIFKIDGTIDEKSNADISVFMEKMPIKKIFELFLPDEIQNQYNVKSGYINLDTTIKGELKNAVADLTVSVNNLDLTDKINKINYLNNLLTAKFNSNFKNYTGEINNSDFKLTMNSTSVDCDKFSLLIKEKDIIIPTSKISINNSTVIDISGDIKNYIKNPEFNFKSTGNLITKDIKKLLGPDLAIYIKEKGTIPFNAEITGDKKKQTLTASIEADKDNYITPVDIESVADKNTIIKTVIDFKGDRLKIKDTGFYIKTITPDEKDPEKTIVNYEEVIGIDGTITKLNTSMPNINLIKVKMPQVENVIICAFPQSKLAAKGNMYIFGDLLAPRVRGEFNIWNMSIPELFITMKKANAKFEGKDLDINIKDLVANGSDYNILINADITPAENFVIKNLNLVSQMTDADKLMVVSEASTKYMPQADSAQVSKNTNTKQANIPVLIKNGNIDMKQIKTGNIVLTNTTGNIALNNNIFYITNFLTSAFEGKIRGNVAMNLITSEIKAALKGNNLNTEKTLLDAANMKDTLTGTLNFDTNISLKGATYEEQMKSLNGDLSFLIKNGTLGPFGKLENLILAENIRESAFFESTIGSVLNSLLSFDTSHYNELKGNMTFNNGIVNINPITSSGDIMGTYIFGDFDILENHVDVKLRGRLGSQVSDSLGPISMINPVNLVKATPGMSLVLGKIFFLFCEEVTEEELKMIPDLGKDISHTNSTKFQVVIRGNAAKPLTLVKSFKWLALASEINAAKTYLDTIPEDTVPAIDITTINGEEIKTKAEEQAKEAIKNTVSGLVDDETKETIKEKKKTLNKIKSLFKKKEEVQSAEENILIEQQPEIVE